MSAYTFDTLEAANSLEDTGFSRTQAEAVVSAIKTAVNKTVATKTDLGVLEGSMHGEFKAVRGEMKSEFKAVRGEMKSEFKTMRGEINVIKETMAAKTDLVAVKADVLIWMFGALIAQGGLIVALIKLL